MFLVDQHYGVLHQMFGPGLNDDGIIALRLLQSPSLYVK